MKTNNIKKYAMKTNDLDYSLGIYLGMGLQTIHYLHTFFYIIYYFIMPHKNIYWKAIWVISCIA